VAWVMSFGGGARVLSPQELKNRVGDAASEILKNN
jgi:predicted DNA-binding transcriptional regulator YafY